MRHRATIREVAALAGCSVSTVSRVLNRTGRIGTETRARVERAAAELDFRFDPIGRSLQSRRTRTIGAMIPTLSNPVFAEAIEGVQSAARARGYQLVLSCSNYAPGEEAEAVSTLLAHRVDGLVLTVSDAAASPAVRVAVEAGAPFVLIFNHPPETLPAVAFDNRAAAREVAERMLALGHRRAAFVAGRFSSSDRSKQRHAGFCEGYAAAGAPAPRLLEVDYTAPSHRAPLAALLAAEPGITGLFCSNDLLALTVIGDLRALGRAVPDALSVVGFDGLAIGAMAEPRLATVATPCARMGAEAARRLIATLDRTGEMRDGVLLLPHAFRPGASLAPAPRTELPDREHHLPTRRIPARPPLTAHEENEP